MPTIQLTAPAPANPPSAEFAFVPTGALAALSLSTLLSSLGTSIANVGLPILADTFAASFQRVQWVVLSYLLGLTISIVGVGRLGDLTGRRRLLLVGIVVFTGASAGCGMVPELWMLTVARGVQGVGAAVMMALSLAFVGDLVPKEKTGRAMGWLATMSAVGTALGPSLGGALIGGLGWRAMFLVNVPLGAAALLLAQRHLPADVRRRGCECARFDFAGALLLALTLGAYALAVTLGRGRFGVLNVALLLTAGFGAGLFVWVEGRTAAPLVRLGMFREAALRTNLLMSALVATVMMTTLVVGPFYLARALRLEAALVGLALSVGPLVAAVTGVAAGQMADKLGTDRTTMFGLMGLVGGSLSLALGPASFGLVGYLAPVVVMTAGYGLFQTANNAATMKELRGDRRGVVSGLLALSRNLGLVSGASVIGAVFVSAVGTADVSAASPEAVARGMRSAFAVAAVLLLVALWLAVRSTRGMSRARGTARRPNRDSVLRSA